MNKVELYKNFNMGRELDIAGTFIYRGIKEYDALPCFREECDIFHMLYDLSVGVERLQKVLLALLANISEKSTKDEIRAYEKSLITHSHQKLHEQISRHVGIEFNPNQNSFLQLLTQFYESCRYERYNISNNFQKELHLFVTFLSERLNIEIKFNSGFFDTPNDDRIKKFFLKVVGTVTRIYYRCIENQAYKLNLFTYEKRFDSAAYKLFLGSYKDDSFYELIYNEKIAISEFFVYLLNHKSEEELTQYVYDTAPLDLDLNELEIYFNGLVNGKIPSFLTDSVETAYDDIDNYKTKKERLALMQALHNLQ